MKTQLTQTIKPIQHYSLNQVQSLAILTMNSSALEEQVIAIAEQNPLLEIQSTFYTSNHTQIDENIAVNDVTLTSELLSQSNTSKFNHKEVANYIIHCLDSNGYCTIPLTTLKKECHTSMQVIKESLTYVQTLIPLGVGARDLEECLTIQCRAMKTKHQDLLLEVLHYLPALAKGHFHKVANECNASEADVKACFELIKQCNPRPGASYAQGASTIIPDIFVTIENDQIQVQVNDITQHLQLTQIAKQQMDSQTKAYLKQQENIVNQLLSAINKRNKTLFEVCTYIITHQQDYFLYDAPLQVMTYSQIAQHIHRHTSTVFRCIQNKALLFNDRILLLSTLFSNEVNEGTSDDAIKKELKRIIEHEDKHKPYSDAQLVEHFKTLNIQVSRRTLTKYREQLHLPNSLKRKITF